VNVLFWHVHGSYATALVQGPHRYFVPVLPDRSGDGIGRAQTWDWPDSVTEIAPEDLRALQVDAVILQRPHEVRLVRDWLGREPGVDLPAVYLEHNAPQGAINDMRHPMAASCNVPVVHVTHFNELFWDCGAAPTRVIEHGIVDPGYRYGGELQRCAVVVNEPLRRHRVTGTDLIARFAVAAPVDVFGMGVEPLGGYENFPQDRLHDAIAQRRVYLHPVRWTSLGLSLIEAMFLGMPVVALATTDVAGAVPPGAGTVSTNVDELIEAAQRFLRDANAARAAGLAGRAYARERFGLRRFLDDWNRALEDITC
jgi:glycosyltransferase involved in cell wall biosynthesis